MQFKPDKESRFLVSRVLCLVLHSLFHWRLIRTRITPFDGSRLAYYWCRECETIREILA